MDEWELLQEYRARNSEAAFAALVSRYVGLVYSSALRQVGQTEMAEEVTQAVFALLARKAGSIGRNILLAGWLFRTTRFVASRMMRAETRRKIREREAIAMQELSAADETWRTFGPLLDEALHNLNALNRNAVLARFMDDKSLRETGAALGITEDAAKKRVGRALEKLRIFFQRRGFAISSVALAAALSERLIGAAPAGLASNITFAVMLKSRSGAPGWTGTSLKIAAVLVGLGIIASFTALHPWLKRVIPETERSSSIRAAPNETARAAAPRPTIAQRLRLRVVGAETGQGLSGVRVFARFWHDLQVRELLTDLNGVCDIPLPAAEFGRLDLGALADWHVQKYVVFREKTVWPIPGEFTLKLERAVSAGGWVRDESGRAVVGAEIWFEFQGRGDHSAREPKFERLGYAEDVTIAKTDASGYWGCATLPPKCEQFTIRVSHPDFLPQGFATDAGDSLGTPMANLWSGNAVLVLKDRKPLSLFGRVTDLQGVPIAGAKVRAGVWTDRPDALTDASGDFQVTRLRAGTNAVTIAAKGFAPEQIFVNVGREPAPVTIQLKQGTLLRVRVLDENQSPVPGATVALFEWRDRHGYNWRANTDAEGIVEWPDAPADAMKFDIFRRGYFRTDEQRLQPNGEVHTVLLRRGLRVTGHVVDEETGERIPKFKVIPGYQEANSRQWFRSDIETGQHGYYEFVFEVWRPPFTVRVEADGYEVAMSKTLQAEPREQKYDFGLKPLREKFAVKGVVLQPDGEPGKGAEVALASLDYRIRLGHKRLRRENEALVTNVNERGEFAFPADRNALTVVAAAAEGFAMARVLPGEPLRMTLQPWGRVEGTVRVPNPSGRPRSVRLVHQSSSGNVAGSLSVWDYQANVDDMGRFVIEDAPPGEFSCVLYNHDGIPGHSAGVDIQRGTTTRVEIGGGGSTVTGRLKVASTNRIDWLKPTVARLEAELPPGPNFGAANDAVTLRRTAEFWMSRAGLERSRANQMYPIEVDANGVFRVHDVPPGSYRMVVVFSNASIITKVSIPMEPSVDLGELVLR